MTAKAKKGLLSGSAAVMCLALLVGGSLAWQDFSQTRTNNFTGNADYDVTLHDDFDGENKDVYVENSGDSTVYVRVALAEYMQVGDSNMLGQDITADGSVTARDKNGWILHKYNQTTDGSVTDCGAVSTDDSGLIQFHSYYRWDLSGKQIKYDPGTPGLISSVLDGTKKDAEGQEITDFYGAPIPVVDDTVGEKDTLPSSAPITMAKFMSLKIEMETSNTIANETDAALYNAATGTGCWLLDGDGWAYWSVPLEPGTATNLLLDSVTRIGADPTDDWYYGVDVRLQAVSLGETESTWKASGGYTDSAQTLIDSWK